MDGAGAKVPFLNEYKRAFFWKRFPQTVLGGINLRITGGLTAVIAAFLQILVLLWPWILGSFFTILLEYQLFGATTPTYVYLIVYGVLMSTFVIFVQLLSCCLQMKRSQVTRLTNAHFLSDEMEVDFTRGFTPEVVQYLFPTKVFKLNVIMHAILAGIMCALSLWYLTPTTLHSLYGSPVVTIFVWPFGWWVVSIAQYSLSVTGPPEPAVYRATDYADLMSLLRPVCVMLFLAVDIFWRYHPGELQLTNQILHILFIFLPVLWTLGVAPPVEALVLWLTEQILVHILGGSAMASDFRLIMMFMLSSVSLLIGSLLPSSLALIIFCSIVGYLLSTDVGGCLIWILSKSTAKTKLKATKTDSPVKVKRPSNCCVTSLYHIFLLELGTVTASLLHALSALIGTALLHVLGFGILALFLMAKLCEQVQKVYIFGFKRNCLFPKDVDRRDKFTRKKKRLRIFAFTHRVLTNLVLPVVMASYLAVAYINPAFPSPSFWLALGCLRSFRWVWQSTLDSALEISITHLIRTIFPSLSADVGLQLLITSFILDRIRQVCHKFYCFWVILITSYSVKKQRRPSTLPMIIVILMFFPVTIAVILIAGLLSAPVLPLFTLPFLFVGFPRPLRSWPGQVGQSANVCTDTIYYKEMMPQLSNALNKSLISGSLGTPRPGSFFLMRFQDRMAWIQVLERGHGFYTLSIKGMELQETSCHTVEAGELEAQFQVAFENQQATFCSYNTYIGHTMVPIDALPVRTYSDARNTLTGVIDSPELLEKVDQCFIKTLIWVMLHHNSQNKKYFPKSPQVKKPSDSKRVVTIKDQSPQSFPPKARSFVAPGGKSTEGSVGKLSKEPMKSEGKDSGHPESLPSRPHSVISARLKKSSSWSSLGSWGDDKSLELNSLQRPNTNHKTYEIKNDNDDNDDFFGDLPGMVEEKSTHGGNPATDFMTFGLPAVDPKMQSHNASDTGGNSSMGIHLGSSLRFQSHYSSRLSLPLKWREIPMDASEVHPILDRFPKEWFLFTLKRLKLGDKEKTSEEVAQDISEDQALVEMYKYLVVACYTVVNINGINSESVVRAGPGHVFKVYSGDIPWSPSKEWLMEDDELYTLVIKAYRLAFKVAYDQYVLGEGDEDEDVAENLQDYEENWYLGTEGDEDWKKAVMNHKPYLFSLMYDSMNNVYNGRVLSHTQIMTYLGSLNPEMVRALWASLTMELLYMTNDDEERYSIQAHPVILRNLTVQAADPPLGYPIYASPPISIPTM